jgi:nicotinamidase-related amidase
MSNLRSIRCVLLGFSLDETVLSTVIDGFHRSHRYQVVGDAVACRRGSVGDAASYKQSVVTVIGNFAGILLSDELIGASGRIAV